MYNYILLITITHIYDIYQQQITNPKMPKTDQN